MNIFEKTPQGSGKSHKADPNAMNEGRAMLTFMFGNNMFQEAAQLANDLVKQFPKDGFSWKVLGASLKKLGQPDKAIAAMRKATSLMPNDYEAFNNLGVALKDLGKVEQAIACYKHALSLKPDFAPAVGNMASALRDQLKLEDALHFYKRKLALVPDDPEALHHIAALTGQTNERAPEKYVEGVFDHYADKFDEHLVGALQYKTPQVLYELLSEKHQPTPAWRVMDLGCGTGLFGAAMNVKPASLVGVDLSGRMLQKAKERGLYTELIQADIVSAMVERSAHHFELLAAADVFVYIGDLERTFEEAKRVLVSGGLFAFSTESLDPQVDGTSEFKLRVTGRFAHAHDYILRLSREHGFDLCGHTQCDVRLDDGKPIRGALYVLSVQP